MPEQSESKPGPILGKRVTRISPEGDVSVASFTTGGKFERVGSRGAGGVVLNQRRLKELGIDSDDVFADILAAGKKES